jgi:hypothetical protein
MPPGSSRGAAAVQPDEVDEVRILSAWVAEHEPPCLALAKAADEVRLERWLARARARVAPVAA